MAVKIRLQRHGAKKSPFYRLVVADSRQKRDGRFVEVLGTYNPKSKRPEEELRVKLDRADYWLGVGAQPSDTVRSLINRARRMPAVEPAEDAEAPAAAPAAEPKAPPATEPAADKPSPAHEPAADQPAPEPQASEEPTPQQSAEEPAPQEAEESQPGAEDEKKDPS